MLERTEFIKHDFQLPNHNNEISYVGDVIEKLKTKQKKITTNVELISDNDFILRYEEIIRALEYVGNLSLSATAIRDELFELYEKEYRNSPDLCKRLSLDHYESIHHPYNLLKSRCYKLLENFDTYYRKLYGKNPPNWEI